MYIQFFIIQFFITSGVEGKPYNILFFSKKTQLVVLVADLLFN